MALNRVIGCGKEGDWNSHMIEHAISAVYDLPHGAGLSIVFPGWMKYVYKNAIDKFKRYAINIWNIDANGKTDEEIAVLGIEETKKYFEKIGAPVTLNQVDIFEEDIEKIVNQIVFRKGSYMNLTKEDAIEILRNVL